MFRFDKFHLAAGLVWNLDALALLRLGYDTVRSRASLFRRELSLLYLSTSCCLAVSESRDPTLCNVILALLKPDPVFY